MSGESLKNRRKGNLCRKERMNMSNEIISRNMKIKKNQKMAIKEEWYKLLKKKKT